MAAALALSFQRGFTFHVFSTNSEISSLCVTSAKKWLTKCLSQETPPRGMGEIPTKRMRSGSQWQSRATR